MITHLFTCYYYGVVTSCLVLVWARQLMFWCLPSSHITVLRIVTIYKVLDTERNKLCKALTRRAAQFCFINRIKNSEKDIHKITWMHELLFLKMYLFKGDRLSVLQIHRFRNIMMLANSLPFLIYFCDDMLSIHFISQNVKGQPHVYGK